MELVEVSEKNKCKKPRTGSAEGIGRGSGTDKNRVPYKTGKKNTTLLTIGNHAEEGTGSY